MKKINIEIVKDLVGTKYNDMQGLISIDTHAGAELRQLCADNKIDMEAYFLLGFGLSDETLIGIGSNDKIMCTVLLLEKSKYGNGFDEISSNISKLAVIDVVKKTFFVKIADLGKYIKRFDFMAATPISNYVSVINITE